MQMRARVISVAGALALTLSVALSGSAYGATKGASATTAATQSKTTGAQHFEVYATNFEASYSPVYFTGVINTVGTGYKDFAEAEDQVYMPEAGGTLVIYHPGLTQTEGTTTTFDPVTCITHIFGSGPVHFVQGTGKLRTVRGTGVVNLDIRVFQRKKADGGCDNQLPPTGYIEIAKGDLSVTLN
jgi:hypothetical protein